MYYYCLSLFCFTHILSLPSSSHAAPSGPPQNLLVVSESSRSLRLTWEPPLQENRNGLITNYTVFIVADDGTSLELTTPATSVVTTDLRPFTTYTCSVAASTSIGRGPSTPTFILTTPEDGELQKSYLKLDFLGVPSKG